MCTGTSQGTGTVEPKQSEARQRIAAMKEIDVNIMLGAYDDLCERSKREAPILEAYRKRNDTVGEIHFIGDFAIVEHTSRHFKPATRFGVWVNGKDTNAFCYTIDHALLIALSAKYDDDTQHTPIFAARTLGMPWE